MAEAESPHYISLPVSLSMIQDLVGPILPTEAGPLVSFEEIPTGWNNKAIKLITQSTTCFLLRLSRNTWPASKIVSEVAALQHVNEHFSALSVPKIFGHGFATNDVPVHWILMEFISGEMLEAVWRELTVEDKLSLLGDIREVIRHLQCRTYPEIGGWTLNESGATVPGDYFCGNFRYQTESDWYLGRITSHLKGLREMKEIPETFIQRIEKTIPHLTQKVSLLPPTRFVLFHGDFAFRNLMITRDTKNGGRPRLRAVLDWEWCGTMPIHNDWIGDWLEEECEADEKENVWIREQMTADNFPIFHNLEGYALRKEISNFLDSVEPWVFEGNVEEAMAKALKLAEAL